MCSSTPILKFAYHLNGTTIVTWRFEMPTEGTDIWFSYNIDLTHLPQLMKHGTDFFEGYDIR